MKVAVQKKKGKIKASDAVERICLDKFDFSIGELNELYDVVDDCDGLITYYVDTTSSFSEALRKRITDLALRKDNLIVDLDELYLISTDFINLAKREHHLKKSCSADTKEIKEFQDKLKQTKSELRKLLEYIRAYIKMIKDYKAARPY